MAFLGDFRPSLCTGGCRLAKVRGGRPARCLLFKCQNVAYPDKRGNIFNGG